MTWRVGRHYPIHVYDGDNPVATFHNAADAAEAVRLHADAATKLTDAVLAVKAQRDALAARLARVAQLPDQWQGRNSSLDYCADLLRAALEGTE